MTPLPLIIDYFDDDYYAAIFIYIIDATPHILLLIAITILMPLLILRHY
jgi:hypothetical protein